MRPLVTLLIAAFTSLSAQQAQRLRLAPPNAALAEEFSYVTWVHELKNSRVIITDRGDGRIVVADLTSGTVTQIGRSGGGPREYSAARPVWWIGGDSALMIDPQRRWLLFDGAAIVATPGASMPAVAATRHTARGADTLGHVFTAGTVAGENGPMGDSTALLRVTRSSGRVDTVGRLKAVVARQTSARNTDGFFSFQMPLVQTAEETVVFADGWIAIARLDPYRVDWRSVDGRWLKGAPLPVQARPLDDREKRAYMDRIANETGRPAQTADAITDWPEMVPPWRSPSMLFAAPDGRAVIPRLASADSPETRYDVINRRGSFDGAVILAANQRIVGFGTRSVYVVSSDDAGLQRLQRHPWPPR